MDKHICFSKIKNKINASPTTVTKGKIISVGANNIIAKIPDTAVNDICYIENSSKRINAKVLSFKGEEINLAIFGTTSGIKPGDIIYNPRRASKILVPENMLGKILDSQGYEILNPDQASRTLNIEPTSPNPLTRLPIHKMFHTGVNSIDAFLSIGIGQRIGLFAEAGTGKSTLLAMIAKNSTADVNVIALIGERGREINEFINESLGETGMKKSVIVASTSDEPALNRKTAGQTATAIAEYYRNQGKSVLLLFDSLTRYARAIREIGLANGELPVREGYTPSVYTELPILLERSGNDDKGSITAIYTVLTNDQVYQDALKDEVKSILDGHIILDRNIANSGIRPAIDITSSISRCINKIQDESYIKKIDSIKKLLARLKNDKELLQLGGKADEELSLALKLEPKILEIIHQGINGGLSPRTLKAKIESIYLSAVNQY